MGFIFKVRSSANVTVVHLHRHARVRAHIKKTPPLGVIRCREASDKSRAGGAGREPKVFSPQSLCKLSLSRRGYCKLQQHGVRETGRRAIAMQHHTELPSNLNKRCTSPF